MSRPSSQTSTSSGGGGGRSNVQQDYIVRIRYANSLPAPPNPPKLLDIPNPALAQYTSTAFASKLAREQPLNVELDSELGMPLDMVHMPGVFEKDESALRPMDPPPPVHPNDRALLRPASALGKPARTVVAGSTGSGVSFLRRTEYISNESHRSTFKSTTSATLISSAPIAKKRAANAHKAEDESDPVRILAAVLKGFDIANPETAAATGSIPDTGDRSIAQAEKNWKDLRHPAKANVKPVEIYPILPDPEGLGELNGYLVYKFSTNPVGSGGKARDERLDVAVMKVRTFDEAVNQNGGDQHHNHNHSGPSQSQNQSQGGGGGGGAPGSQSQNAHSSQQKETTSSFDYYLPISSSRTVVKQIKRKFADLEGNSDTPEELANPDGGPMDGFKYQFLRAYEAHSSRDMQDLVTPSEVALVFHHGGDGGGGGKAAGAKPKPKPKPKRKPENGGGSDLFDDDDNDDDHDDDGANEPATDAPLSQGMSGRSKPKGAYWYPIVHRSVLKAKRNEKRAEGFFRPVVKIEGEVDEEEEGRVDLMSVRVRGLTEEEKARAGETARRFEGST